MIIGRDKDLHSRYIIAHQGGKNNKGNKSRSRNRNQGRNKMMSEEGEAERQEKQESLYTQNPSFII